MRTITCDVLVCGSGKAARLVVLELVKAAGLVGWDAGVLENSMVVEGLTSILINLNKQFGVASAGIRITGVPRPDEDMTLTLTTVPGIPIIGPGDDLPGIILTCLSQANIELQDNDILVIAQKIVSKG